MFNYIATTRKRYLVKWSMAVLFVVVNLETDGAVLAQSEVTSAQPPISKKENSEDRNVTEKKRLTIILAAEKKYGPNSKMVIERLKALARFYDLDPARSDEAWEVRKKLLRVRWAPKEVRLREAVNKAEVTYGTHSREKGKGILAHPYYWPPFVLIGDWR